MKKIFLALSISVFATNAFSLTSNLDTVFQNTSGFFILYNVNEHKLVTEYNPSRCAERLTPASTFKVPLSLMAFDQKLITQKTVFTWDGKDKGLAVWNQNQSPYTWLKNSVVWVSQTLTPQLGLRKINYYLEKFHYGNLDFSGDPYKDNGLTHAWLDSSLKISADEQLDFLKNLVGNTLPVSQEALNNTKQNMYLGNLANGYTLYGKSGTWDNSGWFIGYIQKPTQTYIFVLNFSDLTPTQTTLPGGTRAQTMVKALLSKMSL